jgi:hypothetical protein
MIMVGGMKVHSWMIGGMGKAKNNLAMAIHTAENSLKGKHTAKASIFGSSMDTFTKVSGIQVTNKAMDFGKVRTSTLVSGYKTSPMASASILGRTVTITRVSGSNASDTATVRMCSSLETSMWANTSLEKLRAMVSTGGATAIYTPVSSSMALSKAEELGKRVASKTIIAMLDST